MLVFACEGDVGHLSQVLDLIGVPECVLSMSGVCVEHVEKKLHYFSKVEWMFSVRLLFV